MKIEDLKFELEKLPGESIIAKQGIVTEGNKSPRTGLLHGLYFASWRGIYAQPTLCSGLGQRVSVPERTSVELLLHRVESLLNGEVFQAYKGGDYTFNRDSPLWADEWGETWDTICVSVQQNTKYFEDPDADASFYIATMSIREYKDSF